MKVLRLSFKNLNSLAGVWEVDFKHPDYVSSGIFAITGPTGSGKTTILDAVCLALYGQTPRLSKITQSENEIMSRQSGECFAEVEFETARGRFICHWSQHRSRKLAGGQLQSPRHEISEAETGVILESKLRAVADKVEEVTGMDFDRFTRSMLLAQGGFAAFLQARPDERAPILEQITGTAIYSRISIKVHERTSEERKRLVELRAELDGIQMLTPEEAGTLLHEKAELLKAESALAADAIIIREAQAWREKIATLESELLQLDQDRIAFDARKAAALPELERLALAGSALILGADHAHILSIRTLQGREQDEMAVATEQLPLLQLQWQTAFDALERAEAGLALAKAVQSQEAELIRITRERDVKLGEANAHIQRLSADIENASRQSRGYRDAITECDARINGIDTELGTAVTFLHEHLADAGLVETLTGIEQQLKSLAALDAQCRATQGKLAGHFVLIEACSLASSRSERVWQATQQAVIEAEQRLAELREASADLLQGRDLSAWRDEAEACAHRQSRLGMVAEAAARLEEISSKLAELKLRGEELEKKRHALLLQEKALAGECDLREQVSRRLQDNVMLLNRVRSLEEDRGQLVDGAPCPLCGSPDHPYAAGNVPQPDEVQKELEVVLTEAKRVQEHLSLIRQELVATGKDCTQSGLDLAELQKRRLNDENFCTAAFAELGMTVGGSAWSEAICRESEACSEALASRRGVIQAAGQNQQEEQSAQLALNTLKDELAAHDKARLEARLGQETALADRIRLEDDVATLRALLDRAVADVECAVAPYGYTKIIPDASDDLRAALTSRRTVYVRHMQAREMLEKSRAENAAEKEKQLALLAESEKALNDKEQLVRDKRSQRDALVEQRLEQYGERNPDVEEKQLADALRKAGEVREAALQEQNRLNAELGALKQQMERLSLSIAQRGEQLSELEASFALRLNESGFADEASFLQACLPQESFDALTNRADSLRQDEIALQTRFRDRSESLAAELTKNLTDKPLELIREEHTVVAGQLSELHKGLGSLDQRLQQHAEQQQRQESRLRALELQKHESERWERLHSLIGSGDGKKFRNFAQGLTFELMVAHANRQLQKMSDRYILVRDNSEPLELNVIDNYQAGEVRSTKNLSGGESFIASLALSLGLSSMSSRNVRVDSLFLDEGFGTLDEDALETALETLSGLQQDGKLIGIISHVPALKERIGTQIQLEAGSSGRSSLSGPGCRRIS